MLPKTRSEVESLESWRNSFALSIFIFLIEVLILLTKSLELHLIYNVVAMIAFVSLIGYANKHELVRFLHGPAFLALMLIYSIATRNAWLPDVGVYFEQAIVLILNGVYFLTSAEGYIMLQVTNLLVTYNTAYKEETAYGLLNTLVYILIFYAYEYIRHLMQKKKSIFHSIAHTLPLFRLTVLFMFVYVALFALFYSFKIFVLFTQQEPEEELEEPEEITVKVIPNVAIRKEPVVQESAPVPRIQTRQTVVPVIHSRPVVYDSEIRHNQYTVAPKPNQTSSTAQVSAPGSYITNFYSSKA